MTEIEDAISSEEQDELQDEAEAKQLHIVPEGRRKQDGFIMHRTLLINIYHRN